MISIEERLRPYEASTARRPVRKLNRLVPSIRLAELFRIGTFGTVDRYRTVVDLRDGSELLDSVENVSILVE